ncbi:Kef-type K+ transport system, membrane component KefB [Arenibacter nanhaiticus]|uniref:Kef-type K+ transport system, membrane component KefB n=1 Tax=Arenibacter nanhaiticus TaxID=558155 RepID=A0A1M6LUU7_9FLAO|nr:cation:proton antiporter [Arenibacter nanhaiticus]SHJ74949.1 Kef-type K+ transport system, membrane component KefB [Arenibacter nanhaiticus]
MAELQILNLLLVLVAAWAGGILAKRLGFPPILGELLIGIILGPGLFGVLETSGALNTLAEVGILFLMAYIGMEINFKDLGKASWPGLLAAIGGFVVPFVLGYYTIILFDGTNIAALFVGIAVGVTSLATKSRILVDLKLLNTRIAYVLMAGALISDTLALIIFAGIIGYVDVGSVNAASLSWVAGKAMIFFAFSALIGIYFFPVVGKLLSKSKTINRTVHFTIMVIIVLGFSELAELAGLHGILGAFMAGLYIRDGVFSRQVFKDVTGVFHDVSIGFLAPIFFVTAGFNVSLEVFQTNLLLLILIIAGAVIGKIAGTALFYLPSGHGWREGVTIGTGMNGRGAVEIIIAGIGLQMGIISTEIFSILVFMAISTTLTVPFLLTWTTNWLRKRGELVMQDARKGYLILGANPLGLYIAKQLQEHNEVVLIDANKHLVHEAKEQGVTTIHGNGLKEDTFEMANALNKNTFIALTGNSEINLLAAQLANNSFYIPHKIVLISAGEDGAGLDLLDPMGASSMFASKTDMAPWAYKISANEFKEHTVDVASDCTTREWVKKHGKHRDILPVLIVGETGYKRPFHYKDSISANEKVIYLE